MCRFCFDCSNTFSLSWVFSSLIIMCLGMGFSAGFPPPQPPFGVTCASWICRFMSFTKFRFSAIFFLSNYFFLHFIFSSPPRPPITWILDILILSCRFIRLCLSLFFVVLFTQLLRFDHLYWQIFNLLTLCLFHSALDLIYWVLILVILFFRSKFFI